MLLATERRKQGRKLGRRVLSAVLSAALVLTGAGLGGTSASAAKKTGIVLKGAVYVGGPAAKKTTTAVLYVKGKKVKATFTSSKKKIAKVAKKTGKITAKKAGTVKIVAKAKKTGKKYTVKVKVAKYKYADAFTLNKSSVSLAVGKSATLKVSKYTLKGKKVTPTTKGVKFVLSAADKKKGVITLKGGKITAVKAGTVTVTAKTKTYVAKKTVSKKVKVTVTDGSSTSAAPGTSTDPGSSSAAPGTSTAPSADTSAAPSADASTAPSADASTAPSADASTAPSAPASVDPNASAAPEAEISTVEALNNSSFELPVTLKTKLTADQIKNAVLTLTGPKTVKAAFTSLAEDGLSAVFTVDADGQKELKPGNGTADGDYTITATGINVPAGLKTTYEESLVGNTIRGYVVDEKGKKLKGVDIYTTEYDSVKKESVEVKKATTGDDGDYYFHSVSGVITVTAKKLGYTDSTNKVVEVNKNNPTACNFQLASFAEKEMYFLAKIIDKDSSAPVTGASVTLVDADGNTVKSDNKDVVGKTDDNGMVVFANSAAVVSTGSATGTVDSSCFGENKWFRSGAEAKDFLKFNASYSIKVEKAMVNNSKPAEANYTSVYVKDDNTFANIIMSTASKRTEDTYKATLVKETKKIVFNPAWADATAYNAFVASGGAINVQFVGVDGKDYLVGDVAGQLSYNSFKATELNENTRAAKALDFAGENNIFREASGEVTPRIPNGTYYLVLKAGKENAGVFVPVNAISVATVVVKDGTATVTSTPFKKATKADMTSTINNVKYATNLPQEATTGAGVEATSIPVIDGTVNPAKPKTAGNGYDASNSTSWTKADDVANIDVKYDLYQTVGSVDVLLKGVAPAAQDFVYTLSAADANGSQKRSILVTTDFNNLEVGGAYVAKAERDFLTGTEKVNVNVVDSTGYANNKAEYDGAGNIVKFVVEETTPKYIGAGDKVVATSCRVVDKEGNQIYQGWYSIGAWWYGDKPNNHQGGASSGKAEMGTSSVSELQGLKPGKEYKIYATLTITKYDAVKNEETATDFEEIESGYVTIKDFEESQLTFKGTLTPKKKPGFGGHILNDKRVGLNGAAIALMQKNDDGKWVNKYITKSTANGEFNIESPKAGDYKVVIRAKHIGINDSYYYYETYVDDITIKDGEKVEKDFTLIEGGQGMVDLIVKDQNGVALGALDSTATAYLYDEYYDADYKYADAGYYANDFGRFRLYKRDTAGYNYRTEGWLSIGDYTGSIESPAQVFADKELSYSVKTKNQTVKDENVKVQSAGSNKMTLTVTFDANNASVGGKVPIVVVKDSKGEIVGKPYVVWDTDYDAPYFNNRDGQVTYSQDCTVAENGTYTVEVYQSGYFVGSGTKTMQGFDDRITIGLTAQDRK